MIWTYLRSCYGFDMRTYIGGEERIFPARWFFCDPDAKLFPSPHGAEASPWLKDGEVNEWWGEIKGRKTLDRGINPGYPGQCSVGDAQWFIDGNLPPSILTNEAPVTPLCCGHTPPLNPDPRCPPFRFRINCFFCKNGVGWNSYQLTATGGTGQFAIGNGVWDMERPDITVCEYEASRTFPAYTWSMIFDIGMTVVRFASDNGHIFADYQIPGVPDCLKPLINPVLIAFAGVGDPPTFKIV